MVAVAVGNAVGKGAPAGYPVDPAEFQLAIAPTASLRALTENATALPLVNPIALYE
jgi:hypothetical protein